MPINARQRTQWMLLAGCVILLSLAFRLYRIDTVPLDYDRSYTYGLGVALLDSLHDGTFGAAALRGQPQSLGWPNPVLSNYLMAVIALIDRSPIFAMGVVALISVITTALCIAITRQLFDWNTAILAGLISATSPWSVFFSRGLWQLGFFEWTLALPACLFWLGVIRRRCSLALVGVLAGGLSMQIYAVALGVALQFGIGLPIVALRRPGWRALAAGGILVILVSAAAYGVVLLKADPQFLARPRIRLNYSPTSVQGGRDRGLPVNTLALERSVNLISGNDFPEAAVGEFAHLDPISKTLMDIRVVFVTIAALMGMATLVLRKPRRLPVFLVLLWYWIPVVFITALTTLSRATPVSYYYIILVSPAVYVITGVGMNRLLGASTRFWRINLTLAAALAFVMVVPSLLAQQTLADLQWSAVGAGAVTDLAIGELRPLRQTWETACAELTVPYNPFENRQDLQYWAYSWAEGKGRVAPQTEVNLGTAQTWAGSDKRCALRLSSEPAPPDAVAIAATAHATLYQPRPANPVTPTAGVLTTIGWRLKPPAIPAQIKPGAKLPLLFHWNILSFPDEPHEAWRYDLFVKLLDAGGKVLAQADVAGIPGNAWRMSSEVVQSLILDVPSTRAATDATRIELSLYDRAQQRNALFKSAQPGAADTVVISYPVAIGQ